MNSFRMQTQHQQLMKNQNHAQNGSIYQSATVQSQHSLNNSKRVNES